jgi:hypothetical protein
MNEAKIFPSRKRVGMGRGDGRLGGHAGVGDDMGALEMTEAIALSHSSGLPFVFVEVNSTPCG